MNLDEIISELRSLTVPSRKLDIEIAQQVGWKKKVAGFNDGETGQRKERILWLVPKSESEGVVPRYTINLDHAGKLAQQVAPDCRVCVSWEKGLASAKIITSLNTPFAQASSPSVAICIAALTILREQRST